jgi:hypothetical protein
MMLKMMKKLKIIRSNQTKPKKTKQKPTLIAKHNKKKRKEKRRN